VGPCLSIQCRPFCFLMLRGLLFLSPGAASCGCVYPRSRFLRQTAGRVVPSAFPSGDGFLRHGSLRPKFKAGTLFCDVVPPWHAWMRGPSPYCRQPLLDFTCSAVCSPLFPLYDFSSCSRGDADEPFPFFPAGSFPFTNFGAPPGAQITRLHPKCRG